VTYLDIERQDPYSAEISAPYRLDCALTYRVGKSSISEHAPLDRVDRELSTEEWLSIIELSAQKGIPHLIFTGGEPTLRDDLPDMILHAEELGLVTGLLTDGVKLGDDDYLRTLLVNGLDHLMIIFDPTDQDMWRILEKVFTDDIYTTVHLTLKQGETLGVHIKRLADMGANAISLSAADKDLADKLQELRDLAAVSQLDLVWDLPVPYSSNNPVSLELEQEATSDVPEGAGKAWLYVEPDGDVLPAQGLYTQIIGNLISDSWEDIWKAA
jgi:organic radical activating enzyme